MIIYIDMDDTICDFSGSLRRFIKNGGTLKFPQSKIGFFENLPPLPNALESVNQLRQHSGYDVYILTAPSTRNPSCYSEKRIWIEKHFDYDFTKKLIISPNKGLFKGDILIDDHICGKGQENFKGRLIHFGSSAFPDWTTVVKELCE
jgi:5'-nucleotidase